jgi:hypothetical protein
MSCPVIASEAKQSRILPREATLDCFVACAPLRKRFAFVAGNDGTADELLGCLKIDFGSVRRFDYAPATPRNGRPK